MPVLHTSGAGIGLLETVVDRGLGSSNPFDDFSGSSTNITDDRVLQVICAWPVSGQYGPGSRVLYYVLIAACVFARKAAWIRNAALAAALILPAVAAIHAIALAALHRDGAVDMDVYGAFQFCSIAIVAAPVTVRLSQTYFNTPGRNTIFIWAGLILMGLICLAIEFYRIQPFAFPLKDNSGNYVNSRTFPYGTNITFGHTCSIEDGPFSPMREDSANNIYIIPSPETLTSGTATLLAAGLCVHAILWMTSMFVKIMETKGGVRLFQRAGSTESLGVDEQAPIAGTNGATQAGMRHLNARIRFYLSIAVVPIFGGAGLALLVFGEINFFSKPVNYQTEPVQSIGQWAPIVGTGLATLGSLYLLLAADVEAIKADKPGSPSQMHCTCTHHNMHEMSPSIQEPPSPSSHSQGSPLRQIHTNATSNLPDFGHRRQFAKLMLRVGDWMGNTARELLEDSEFRVGLASNFPEIPGEDNRNPALPQIREQYNPQRDLDGNASPRPRSRSRADSFISSMSAIHDEDGPDQSGTRRNRTTSDASYLRPDFRQTSSTPLPEMHQRRRRHADTFPSPRSSTDWVHLENVTTTTSSTLAPARGRQLHRRGDRLEVPEPVHFGHTRLQGPLADEVAGPSGKQDDGPVVEHEETASSGQTQSHSSPD